MLKIVDGSLAYLRNCFRVCTDFYSVSIFTVLSSKNILNTQISCAMTALCEIHKETLHLNSRKNCFKAKYFARIKIDHSVFWRYIRIPV